MKLHAAIVALVVLSTAAPVTAGPTGPDETVVPRITIDCARPRLPPQQEVGVLLGQYNLSQVYASRAALMAEARRACRRHDARPHRVVFERALPRSSEARRVADNRRSD